MSPRPRFRPTPAAAARLGVSRELLERALRRAGRGDDHGDAPVQAPPTARCGSVLLRPLQATDYGSWASSMRENEDRMRPWWNPEADWKQLTSESSFYDHYVTWRLMERRRTGRLRAITDGHSVVGELAIYAHAGGRVQEFGLWCAPGAVSALDLFGALCACVDGLMGAEGVERIDAPVAVHNAQPVRFLTSAGFLREGTLEGWRPLGHRMVDMDMYGLTAERWASCRPLAYRKRAWVEIDGLSERWAALVSVENLDQ